MRSARWEARTAMKRVRPTPVGERKKHVRKLDAPAPSRRQLTMTAGGRKVLDASSCGVSAEAGVCDEIFDEYRGREGARGAWCHSPG